MNPGTVAVALIDDGRWSACFGLSYRDLLLRDLTGPQQILPHGREMRQLSARTSVAASRNLMARSFLDDTECEWLWFVDVDMGFAADTVERLVTSADPEQRPVMGGLCFAIKRQRTTDLYGERFRIQPTVFEYLELAEELGFRPILNYDRDQVMRVAGTGAACLLIHRGVLETVRGQAGDTWFEPITHPTGVKGKPRAFSEDLSFCVRVAAAGFDVHVNTAVKTCHEKGGIFLDEDLFDQQQRQGAS